MAGLEIRGLVVGYGRRPVAGPLDFDLDQTSLNLICAPNGWGKTALLRTLAGLESPCSGRIAALPGPLSWVPQESKFDVDSPVRVDEFIRLHLDRSWKTARKRAAVREALELVGKPDILGRPCRQLSGGEKQSVLIARALAREPRSILLDEPLSALDRDRKRQLIETLAALVKRGVLVVLVSHEMPEMEIAVPLRTIELDGMTEAAP